MNQQEAIDRLEREWERPDGFFARLRVGMFDPAAGERVVNVVGSIDLRGDTCIERRLVSLLWYLPSFTEWQRERVAEVGGDLDTYIKFVNRLNNTLEQLLGVP